MSLKKSRFRSLLALIACLFAVLGSFGTAMAHDGAEGHPMGRSHSTRTTADLR
ncbi:MAG: hypothetical protein IPK82_02535 [Polyangiaceae bacterium]|nr:hypothetical protein [Polyangiaceae bacterium]